MFGLLSFLMNNFLYLFLKVSYTQSFPPPLSPKEEAECFRRMGEGDKKAREKLIEHNLRLVAHIVKKYYTTGVDQEDLISIGTIGLIKAIDSFNPQNGARFATYAGKCLQNEILMYFRSQKKTACEVSINEAIDTDKEGNPLTYGDIISVEDTIAEDLDIALRSAAAKKVILNRLDARARKIICLRYGLFGNDTLTQREVAERMGISRSYVSRIEKAALAEIGAHISDYSI
ncbi:MAG: RNA polymerase sporulation sigma factor SigK [Clostridia bacterium]|nr:RNA polymerase sporulation sigma factor SigK [Clostridia bacterium]